MTDRNSEVRGFFEHYARARTIGDIDLIAAQYPDAFMVAGPKGARVAEKAKVIAAFPKGREFLQTHGHRSTAVLSVTDTSLDDHYVLARVQFAWRFETPPAVPIDVPVDSTFVLFVTEAGFTIVFQQEHEDFQEALRSRGVLPPKT
jgi:hypothetical protein